MPAEQPLASLSLDLDDLWSYLRTHGDPAWRAFPSYLDRVIPLVLAFCDERALRLTLFVVGRDAARPAVATLLREVPRHGHEVGNHSYEHEPWLDRYDDARLEAELARAEAAIEAATGVRPTGFRGPGYSWSPRLLELLAARGYVYDASTLPTFIGPLARRYYFQSARLTPEERAERAALFGRFGDGFRPLRPYRWPLPNGGTLLEVPVTTMPVLRLPIHLSYLLWLARRSERLMLAYLRGALALCRALDVAPSYLLHPLDLVSGEEVPALRFFPGMDLPGSRKREIARRVLGELTARYRMVPLGEHAQSVLAHDALPSAAAAPARPSSVAG
jgi:peptidoglycan/xylan/chitin deacetylase (PgdA/CDA1 family)